MDLRELYQDIILDHGSAPAKLPVPAGTEPRYAWA